MVVPTVTGTWVVRVTTDIRPERERGAQTSNQRKGQGNEKGQRKRS